MRSLSICGLILWAAILRAQSPNEIQPGIIIRSDPEYSAEATRARVQSTVLLSIIVGEDGKAHDIKVAQGAGFGLDEKAIEAMGTWVFRPGMKDGKPAAMPANVEMNFHLQIRNDSEDHSNQFARLNFTLPPEASRPELVIGKLPGNPAAAGDQALRIHVQVGADGVPANVTVLGSTDKVWEQQAVRVIRAWRFRPASLAGLAIPAEGVFELAHSSPPEPEPMIVEQDDSERAPHHAAAPIPVSGLIARGNHTATLLRNGTVLIAGGVSPGRAPHELASAQTFDPVTRTIANTGSMVVARQRQTATLLKDGMVLITGGEASGRVLASAELFDPSTGKFSSAGSMREARSSHAAALLPDGRVLICGGSGANGKPLASAEIYDPRVKEFITAAAMTTPESSLNAVTLKDGRVFLPGDLAAAAIFNPETGTFTTAGDMTTPQMGFSAAVLKSGEVLIAGADSAEVFDPLANSFHAAGPLAQTHSPCVALALMNGKAFIMGGSSETETFDPNTGTAVPGPVLNGARKGFTATLLDNGNVFIAGSTETDTGARAELLIVN